MKAKHTNVICLTAISTQRKRYRVLLFLVGRWAATTFVIIMIGGKLETVQKAAI